ncbi:MAG: efflux RND transporter permease subunit, partial [Exilibacterium sp.]
RSRLEAYGLTLPEVAERVRQSNIDIDAGTLEEDGKVLVVRGISRYHDLKDIQQVVIRYEENANGDVTPIRVANFAKVALVNKDISHTVRVNGVEGVGLAIYKESGSNTVAVSQVVHTAMQAQTVDMPGIDVTWVSDQAELVENAFTNVTSALLLGILLAVAVLIAYLRSLGSVLVVAIAVPVSLLATVFAMQLWGLSLNLITLAGLALGTGMLVDNAIVVIESIFRHRAEGDEPETAAAEGTASVGGAIVASTLTTCVVFLPVLFVQGIAARFVEGISFTVVLSLLSSLLVAIFLIPSLSVWLLPKSNPGLSLNNERWQHFIHRLLLRPRHCVILCLLLTAGAIYWLAQLGTELLPPSDQRQFSLLLTGQAGEKVESTQVRVEQVESILKLAAEGKIAAMMAEVGRPPDNDRIIRERQTEENTAELTVRLTQDSETANQIVSKARPAVSQLFGTQVSWQLNNSAIAYAMGSSAPPVLIELSGRSLEDLHRSAERLGKNLTRQPALWNVKTSFEGAPQEVHIKLDRHRSDSLGVDMELVGLVLSSVTEGYLTTEMTMGDEEREVIIKMPSRRSDQLLSLPFHTQNGRYLTIGDVAQVQLVEGARKILRRNQHRVAQISALIRPGITVPQAQAQAQQTLAQTQLPQGISASITGLEEERERTVSELYWVGLVAIALVFFVLAGSFESLLHPFTVLAAIPISLIGVA